MIRKITNKVLYKFFSMMEYRKKEFSSKFYCNQLNDRLKKRPKGLFLEGKIEVIHPQGLILGDNIHIGENSYLNCRGGLIIGDRSYVERNVSIISATPIYGSPTTPYDSIFIPGRIIIGKGVYIGMNVSILPGVTIGDGAIIETGSVVRKNVEGGAVISSIADNHQINDNRNLKSFNTIYENKRFLGEDGLVPQSEIFKNNRALLSSAFNDDVNPVFILSTGRAGSKSIAAFLNQYPDIEAYHELFYDFFKVLSTNYLTGKIDRNFVKKEIIKLYSSIDNFDAKKIFVDSDQKLAPFVDILIEIFPSAKFIWLIRKPQSFLSSARARGWFQNDAPVFNETTVLIQKDHYSHGTRITGDALINSEQVKDWEEYSIDDRILWYWYYWNKLIQNKFNQIPREQKFIVKLEQLELKKEELISFIGADSEHSYEFKKTNKVKKQHQKNYSADINSGKIKSCIDFYKEIN